LHYIGFDLSLSSTGVAVIDEEGYIVETMAIKTDINDYRGVGGFSERVVFITEMLMSVLREYRPAKLAIEAMPFGSMGYGVMDRAKLLGALEYRIATETPEHKGALYVYPRTLKKACTGSGKSDKSQIKHAVDSLYGYDLELTTDDEYDAMSLALYVGGWFNA